MESSGGLGNMSKQVVLVLVETGWVDWLAHEHLSKNLSFFYEDLRSQL